MSPACHVVDNLWSVEHSTHAASLVLMRSAAHSYTWAEQLVAETLCRRHSSVTAWERSVAVAACCGVPACLRKGAITLSSLHKNQLAIANTHRQPMQTLNFLMERQLTALILVLLGAVSRSVPLRPNPAAVEKGKYPKMTTH